MKIWAWYFDTAPYFYGWVTEATRSLYTAFDF
jgi:hypothetical protein